MGVDRKKGRNTVTHTSFPHTRGGGPLLSCYWAEDTRFSPHAWGWTEMKDEYGDWDKVFPTRVGVDRAADTEKTSNECFPHTRGGGPACAAAKEAKQSFSPHAWGWTARLDADTDIADSFPHTRGGGPHRPTARFSLRLFSPHAWGWTGITMAKQNTPKVFPTRVGVDRSTSHLPLDQWRFSPHAWGWTAVEERYGNG